jgi:enamine deaminase RidA (YjgF/YER057c/UK114 family)
VATRASERIAERGIQLPALPEPKGAYTPVVVDGSLAFVSGQIVSRGAVAESPGQVGGAVPAAVAKDLARTAALQAVSLLAAALGSVDRVRRIVRVGVFVASAPGFDRQHEVANGASEVLIEIFGEAGRASRVSVGVTALPLNAPVEVEMVVAIG